MLICAMLLYYVCDLNVEVFNVVHQYNQNALSSIIKHKGEMEICKCKTLE